MGNEFLSTGRYKGISPYLLTNFFNLLSNMYWIIWQWQGWFCAYQNCFLKTSPKPVTSFTQKWKGRRHVGTPSLKSHAILTLKYTNKGKIPEFSILHCRHRVVHERWILNADLTCNTQSTDELFFYKCYQADYRGNVRPQRDT